MAPCLQHQQGVFSKTPTLQTQERMYAKKTRTQNNSCFLFLCFYTRTDTQTRWESAGGGPSTNNFHAHLAKEKVYSQVHE